MRQFLALFFTLFLLAPSALAGTNVVDLDFKSRICANTLVTSYDLRREMNGTAVTKNISYSDFQDLIAAAAVSQTEFDSEASAILGTFYTALPEETGNTAKTAMFLQFEELADAD